MVRVAKALALRPGTDPAAFEARHRALIVRFAAASMSARAVHAIVYDGQRNEHDQGRKQPPRRDPFAAQREAGNRDRPDAGGQTRVAELAVASFTARVRGLEMFQTGAVIRGRHCIRF